MLAVNLSHRAEKFLRKVASKHAKQLAQKITALQLEPFPQDAKKLQGSEYLRTDSGEYRIIYSVQRKTILIYLIGQRNDNRVYRQWKHLL